MSVACPGCGAAIAAKDPACPSCGQEKPAAAARPKAGSDDALQYVKINGIMVVVILGILIVSGMMGPGSKPCGDCRGKKVTLCSNCEGTRNVCKNCKGQGHDPQTFSTCPMCAGKGVTAACWKCGGNFKKNCQTCKGTGIHPE